MLTYLIEGCVVFWVYGAMVITMGIENVPSEYVVPAAVAVIATAIVLYVVFYLVSYQNKKSKTLALEAEAIQKGTAIDTIAVKRVETFHLVYKVAMLLGIIIVSAIAFTVFATAVASHMDLVGDGHIIKCCVYAAGTTLVTFAIFDYFIGRPIADGTFKAKVIDPLEQAIVDEFHKSAEAPAGEAAADDKKKAIEALAAIAEILKKE